VVGVTARKRLGHDGRLLSQACKCSFIVIFKLNEAQIWSTDWWHDCEEEAKKLLAFLEKLSKTKRCSP